MRLKLLSQNPQPAPRYIFLSEEEYDLPYQTGLRRHHESRQQNLQHTRLADPSVHNNRTFEDWIEIDVNGAASELAAAKAIGYPWIPTVNTFKAFGGDGITIDIDGIPTSVQVRMSDRWSSLIFRPGDPLNDIYIFVRGSKREYTVFGWCFGHEMTQRPPANYVREHPPCWMMSWIYLHDLKLLERGLTANQVL